MLSNFYAIKKKKMPYDELGPKDLSILTGMKKSIFENLEKPCVIVVICDDADMTSLLEDTEGKLTEGVQIALRKSAIKAIEDNFERYSAKSIFFFFIKLHLSELYQVHSRKFYFSECLTE